MSQGNFNAPPPKSGGMSTLTIVLIVVVVLGLICVGACGTCYFGAQALVNSAGGMMFAEAAMVFVNEDQAVKDELGEPLTQENAKFVTNANGVVVDFDVKGPKGVGKGHAEFTGANPQAAPGSPQKPGTIQVTLPSGKTVAISTDPPSHDEVAPGEMPEDSGDTSSSDPLDTPEGAN